MRAVAGQKRGRAARDVEARVGRVDLDRALGGVGVVARLVARLARVGVGARGVEGLVWRDRCDPAPRAAVGQVGIAV